jgi:alanyl-tRNA synthetase
VRTTAEIGPFRILSETSSSANVRRIEAVTGPAAVELLRRHDSLLGQIATGLRTRPEDAPAAVAGLSEERKRLEKALKQGPGASATNGLPDLDQLAARATERDGATILAAQVPVPDGKLLLELTDRLKGRLPGAAILLGSESDGRVQLIVSIAPELVARGVKAGTIVKLAAAVVGGGGGGRDTLAQAGGRDPEKLDEAIATGLAAIEAALAG